MIRKKMPNFKLKAQPHIQSRHRFFKIKYAAICEVQGGSCSGFGWDESKKRVIADDDVFNEWIKSHPGCKGLNKKPFLYFDQLARIFGKDRAMGGQAQTSADVREVIADHNGESCIDLDEETTQRILEDMVHDEVDHGTLLSDETDAGKTQPGTSIGSNKKPRHERNVAVITAVTAEIGKLQPVMEQTATDVHRIANSFCMEDDLIARRRSLFDELSKVEGLTRNQVLQAAMVLVKDVSLADLCYQLPTEDQLSFLLQLIN
ncbi:unnamed protein product [Linum tenue]|uniref:Myb/SANT-like domain-containing protein n=1 Tax=Linum tenue TaxID=586396 RepID=A0AAV0PVM3_9ROSI|nr:unnamed protein product [Linum tenue]